MYSDLFDALGGAGSHNASTSTSTRDEPKPLLSFKAGKMDMALQENGKYTCIADTRRGQVNLKYNEENHLIWEWYDRREKAVVDTIRITDPVTLARAPVPESQDADSNDRVYFWKLDDEWRMIWLQDKENDSELIDKANGILKKPTKPAEEVGAEAAAGAAASSTTPGAVSAPSPGNASTSSASTTTRQVDALSNILENLGMPQGETHNPNASSDAATTSDAAAVPAGTLTLADLQGVMAGLQPQQQGAANPPGLQEIVTPDAITELLANEEVRNRLLQELPEEQRSMEHLEENLRSPQVQQTLRSLTAALLPDDNGSMDGYHSVLANFQLDAAAGQQTLTDTNSPIQAFLDCVLASVEKDKEETKDEEMKE
jgi:26S proteasome regulatory subunit N13